MTIALMFINENFISAVPQMLSDLGNLVFVPFDICGESENLNICDNDPDLHFFKELRHVFNCAYYTEDGFNQKCTNMGTDVNSNLSFIHSNICRISRNINSFLSFISNLINDFDFVCLSEKWLKESNFELYDIPGYHHLTNDHRNKSGGGCQYF